MNKFVLRCWLSRLSSLRDINKEISYLSHAKGWGRVIALPAAFFSIADVLADIDHNGPLSSLYDKGWKDSSWSCIGNDWVASLIAADRSLSCMKLRIPSGDNTDYYPDLGIVVVHESNNTVSIVVSPDTSAFRSWLNVRLADKAHAAQQIIRLQKVSVTSSASWRGSSEITKWGFRLDAAEKKALVRGTWAPSVENIADTLKPGNSILLFGPSGCGKTETAIQAALHNGASRVLVIPGGVVGSELYGSSLASLMDLLGASVLVIDDLAGDATVAMLDHFEMLKNNNFSVIVTLMTDNGPVSLPGLRPGRIDQFFSFDTPTTEDRINLLHYYAPNVNFAGSDQLTRKFTPAYLKELAKRAVASGETDKKAWESAARSLQVQLEIVNR